MSQNDVDRQGGMSDAYVTVGLLSFSVKMKGHGLVLTVCRGVCWLDLLRI